MDINTAALLAPSGGNKLGVGLSDVVMTGFSPSGLSIYAARVQLVACPFCRELFEADEESHCPVCGFELRPMHKLPLSHDAAGLEDAPTAPEFERLPALYWQRSRGALVVLGIIGLVLFFLPWIRVTLPHDAAHSGFALSHRLGWSWGAGVAWVVLVPTVFSRRSILQMRGARVAAAALAAFPGLTAAILLLKPLRAALVPLRYTYEWPIYATVAASLVAIAFALRLGGRVDDIRVTHGSSTGQPLH